VVRDGRVALQNTGIVHWFYTPGVSLVVSVTGSSPRAAMAKELS
jgi:hypothetical protein